MPKRGQICKLEKTSSGWVNVKTGKGIVAGSVPSEISTVVRRCMRKKMTVKVKVLNPVPLNEGKRKGEEIKCMYMFTGPPTAEMKNLQNEVEQGTPDKLKQIVLFFCF